jgi:hypothetical protein
MGLEHTPWRGLWFIEVTFVLEVLSLRVGLLKLVLRELVKYNLKWMEMQVRLRLAL